MPLAVARQEYHLGFSKPSLDEFRRRPSEGRLDLDFANLLESCHLVKAAAPDDADNRFDHDLLIWTIRGAVD
jgi:hypothetical protein